MARFMRTSGVHRDALYYVTDDGEWRHDVIFLHTSKRVATELSAVAVQGAVHIRERCRLASVLADAILTGVLKDLTAAHETAFLQCSRVGRPGFRSRWISPRHASSVRLSKRR